MNKITVVGVILAWAMHAQANAQESQNTSAFDDLPLTITESNLPQTPHTGFNSLYVISHEMIQSSNARSIGDLLKMVPGLVVGNRYGHWLSLGYHGSAEDTMRRVNVVVDGRSIYNPVSGGFISYNLPVQLEDVERIEVTRGPSHSDFGPNSSALTIQIYTAHAAEKQGTTGKVRIGSNNIKDSYLQHGFNIGKTFITTSFYEAQDDGVKYQPDDRINYQMFLRADNQITDHDEVSISGGMGVGKIDYWQTVDFNSNDHDASDKTWWFLGNWRHGWDDGSDISTNFAYTYLDRKAYYRSEPKPVSGRRYYDTGVSYETYQLDSKYQKQLTENTSAQIGTLIKNDTMIGENYLKGGKKSTMDASIFGRYSWQLAPTWTASGGFMREYSQISHESTNAYSFTLLKALNANHSLRFGYNEGQRQPLMYEQYAHRKYYLIDQNNKEITEIISLDQISSERVKSYDVSWLYQNSNRNFSSEVRVFQDNYVKLITHGPSRVPAGANFESANGPLVISPKNVDRPGKTSGLETSFSWHYSPKLHLSLSLAYQDIDSNVDTTMLFTSSGETGPSKTGTLMATYKFDAGIEMAIQANHVSSFNWSNKPRIGEQNNIDLSFTKCFKLDASVCGTVAVENALGNESDFIPNVETKRVIWNSWTVSF